MRYRPLRSIGLAALSLLAASRVSSAPVEKQQVLLDAARAGTALVAVGERGTVLRSEDQGITWYRETVPTHAALTAVHFIDENNGTLAGHENTVLTTKDGGKSWSPLPTALGADASLLCMGTLGTEEVFAGAFGALGLRSSGGSNVAGLSNLAGDAHLYALEHRSSGGWLFAGEKGTLLVLEEDLHSARNVAPPGTASLHGLLSLGAKSWLAYGIQGHIYRSENDGESWEEVTSPTTGLLATGAVLSDGRLVLAGQARVLLQSEDAGKTWKDIGSGLTTAIAKLLLSSQGKLLAVGEDGITPLNVPPRAP